MRIPLAPTGVAIVMAAGWVATCNGFSPSRQSPPLPLPPLFSTAAGAADGVSIISSASNAVVGEADRSFRQGIQFERFGLFRAAAASFHEAATLYQCFLDQIQMTGEVHGNGAGSEVDGDGDGDGDGNANAFGHVTGLNPGEGPDSCTPVLAHACMRLATLTHDALGDSKAAARLYREAATIDPAPSSVAYDGMGTSIEASGGSLNDAADAYREARRLDPRSAGALFHLAVALERIGDVEKSEPLMDQLRRSEARHSCLVDSWGYVRWHTRQEIDANLHRGTRSMLQIALAAALPMVKKERGVVCEFGVGSGRSLRMIQEILPLGTPIHGFDTFTGLPQPWGEEPAGAYSTGGVVPYMEGEVLFHRGLFADAIPAYLDTVRREEEEEEEEETRAGGKGVDDGDEAAYHPLAFAHVDCNLYGSTLDVLETLYSRIVPGTVIVFGQYLGHPTWRQDEFRAWREACKRFGWQYRYLGFSLSTMQAVVQVTE